MAKAKTKLVGVRLDDRLVTRLRVHAAKTRKTMSGIMSEALSAYLAAALMLGACP